MKYTEPILCFLAGISILLSCQSAKSYPEAMQQAERCIVQYPDSALIYLSSLDSAISSEPEETRMYYELLTIKAKDKLYITHTSDSLIKEVVRFYESYGDADKQMEAYYYLGSVYRDMKDAPRAITAFQQAVEAGKNSRRYDILGHIYEQTGTLFAYQSLYEDAMKAYKTSYSYYQSQKDEVGIVYALRNQARMYESLGKLDSTENYYRASYLKALETKDQEVIHSITEEFGNIYLNLGKLDSAKTFFSRIPKKEDDAIYLYGLGSICQTIGKSDSARFYYQEVLREGKKEQNMYVKSSAYKALALLEAGKGDYQAAYNYAQQSLALKDSIRKITRTEAIGKIHALYNYRIIEKENLQLIMENEQKRSQNRLLILGLLTIVGVAAFAIHYLRKHKSIALAQEKRLTQLKEEQYRNSLACIRENEKKIAELETLLQQTEVQKDTLQKQLIFSEKELLEVSNRKIQMAQNEKDLLEIALRKSKIYQLFHQAVQYGDISLITEEEWKTLRRMIDTTYPYFTGRLYALCPQISEQELSICYLVKIRIPVKGIAQLLNRTTSAITNCRIRLYKKIHGIEGKAENLDKFIVDL